MPIDHKKKVRDSKISAKVDSIVQNTVNGAMLGASVGGVHKIGLNPFTWPYLASAEAGLKIGGGIGLARGVFDSSDKDAEALYYNSYNELKKKLKREPTEIEISALFAEKYKKIRDEKSKKAYDSFVRMKKMNKISDRINSLYESKSQPKGEEQMNHSGRRAPNHRDFMSNQSFRESVHQEPQILRPNTYHWWEGNRLREDIYNEQQEARFMESYSRLMEADFIDGPGSKHFGADVEEVIQATEEAVKSGNPKWKEMLNKLEAFLKTKAIELDKEFDTLVGRTPFFDSSKVKKASKEVKRVSKLADEEFPGQLKHAVENFDFLKAKQLKERAEAKRQFLNSLKKRVESIKALANANKKMLMAAGAGAGILGLGAAAGYMMNGDDED